MSFRSRRVLLSTPFYMLFEFFLLKYMFLLIGGVEDIYILILTLIIGAIRCMPMFFEAKKSRKATRFLTTVDGMWMWASLMFLIDTLIIYLINSFVVLSSEMNLILLAIVPILGAYNYWKAHKLVINEKTITLNNLERDISIAHLSDIHFGSVRHRQIIGEVSDKLKQLENVCELAIISGDLADGSSIVEPDDFNALADVNMPIIFTPGNHDFYPGVDNVIKACKNAGIIVLDNDSMEFDCLNIFGFPYRLEDNGILQIDESVIRKDKVNILNYHVPYYFDEFSKFGFDIQLSGHTHGGQFYPAVFFTHLMFKYNMGLFKDDDGHYIHVTTGVGSMDTPMRWGTDSEIVVLKLKKAD